MSAEAPAMTEKQVARAALDRMPETVSLEEISEEMAILAALRESQAAAAAGQLVSHDEVKRRLMTRIRRHAGAPSDPCKPDAVAWGSGARTT